MSKQIHSGGHYHESTEYQAFTQLIVERVMNRLLRNRLNHNHALLSYVAGNDSESILCNERYQIVHLPEEYEKFEELSIGSDIESFCRNYESLYNVQEIYKDKELIGYKYQNVTRKDAPNGSKAEEKPSGREEFNNKFTTIEGNTINTGKSLDEHDDIVYDLEYKRETSHKSEFINKVSYNI